jgi:RNA polymerase sigma factor (sigma-70 family)
MRVDYAKSRDYFFRYFTAKINSDPAIDGDDAAQEAALRLFEFAQGTSVERLESLQWRIATQVLFDINRLANNRARLYAIFGPVEHGVAPPPEDHVFPMMMIEAGLNLLTARARETFLLRRAYGHSQKEIARQLCISENTVEQHCTKAVRALSSGQHMSTQWRR